MSDATDARSGTPLQAVYFTRAVNAPVDLYTGPMTFRRNDRCYTGDGKLSLEWLTSPRLRIRLRTPSQPPDLKLYFDLMMDRTKEEPATVELSGVGQTISVGFVTCRLSSDSDFELSAIVEKEIVTGTASAVSAVIFHLPNVPALHLSPDRFIRRTENGFSSSERVVLRADEWVVTLDPAVDEKELLNDTSAARGYALTWVGKLERSDSKRFSLDDGQVVLDVLEQLLWFAFHRWCPALLLVGLDEAGERKCERWVARKTGPFQPHQGWFDLHHPGALADLFPTFWQRWQDDELRDALKDAIYWYVEIHRQPIHVETGVVVGQVALEMLAWLLLVENAPMLSEGGFSNLPAADKLKLLLSSCSIPVVVPVELDSLAKVAKAENWQGPDAIVAVRNSIVHRNKKKREQAGKKGLGGEVLYDAYALTCQYIELVLLHVFGYQGQYSNRLKERWVGQTEPVPWSKPVPNEPTHAAKPTENTP